jgi:hypothetical protein
MRRPSRTIAVIGDSCEGQPAEMSISFYLGHLREVTCYPQDADAMLQELAKAGFIEGGKRAFKVTRGDVSVAVANPMGAGASHFPRSV